MKITTKIFLGCIFLLNTMIFAITNSTSAKTSFHSQEKVLQRLEKIKKDFQGRMRKYTLKNGIRVLLVKNGVSPTISAYLKIGVGAANEPFNLAGTAHFLEHLLFKGTKELGTKNFEKEKIYLGAIAFDGERYDFIQRLLLDPLLSKAKKDKLREEAKVIARRMKRWQEQAGKYIISEEDSQAYSLAGEVGYNAYTSNDVTNYQINLPKNRLKLWAYLESHRFLDPVFREYYKERKVIQEERRMRKDSNPASLLYELYNKIAFGFSPYGKPVIGFSNNIPRLRLQDTKRFFKQNYIPSRMVIAIVGDIEYDKTLAIIKDAFEKLPTKKMPEFPPIKAEHLPGRKTAELIKKYSPYMITGWLKPSIRHKDNLPFEVLSQILTGGKSSRLYKRLVLKERLVADVRSYNGVPAEKLDNSFTIFVRPYKKTDYNKIYKIINEELELLAKNGATSKELKRIINQETASLIRSMYNNSVIADNLSYYEVLLNDADEFFNYINKLQKVQSSDIQYIVKKYCIDSNNITVMIK